MADWNVFFSRDARKQYNRLGRSGSKPTINNAMGLLLLDLGKNGPEQPSWSNYGPLGKERYHCHLRKGRPTYKAHLTRQTPCKVVIELPSKQKKLAFVPVKHIEKLEAFLEKYGESDLIPWEEVVKDQLTKHGKAGMALRGARYRESFSQKALAKKTGVSQENISKIENGHRVAGEKVARKLAKALRIDFRLLME